MTTKLAFSLLGFILILFFIIFLSFRFLFFVKLSVWLRPPSPLVLFLQFSSVSSCRCWVHTQKEVATACAALACCCYHGYFGAAGPAGAAAAQAFPLLLLVQFWNYFQISRNFIKSPVVTSLARSTPPILRLFLSQVGGVKWNVEEAEMWWGRYHFIFFFYISNHGEWEWAVVKLVRFFSISSWLRLVISFSLFFSH